MMPNADSAAMMPDASGAAMMPDAGGAAMMPDAGDAAMMPGAGGATILGGTSRRALEARVTTLTGSGVPDAVRDSQDILEPLLSARGLSVQPVDLGTWSLPQVPKILRAIRQARPDAILIQYPTAAFGASFGPVAIGSLQRIAPLVVMLHEFVAAHPLRKLAIGGLTARADLVATTAEREALLLGRWYPWLRSRIRSVPIASNIPPRDWAPTQPPKVVYFGQLRPEKGIEAFFQCRAIVAEAMPGVDFEIVGATVPRFGEYAAKIATEARAGNVRLVQGLDNDAVSDWLTGATIALLPFPDGASFRRSSMMAASACGVPLVTTTGADTPRELSRLLEPASTPAELALLALHYLRDGSALKQAHERSIDLRALSSWDRTVDRYVDVLSEAIDRRRMAR